MTKAELKELINRKNIILDGATGTNLQMKGMPAGVCPEQWILENKEVLIELQSQYVEAGSHIIYAPTFSCNRVKLLEYGLEDKIEEMNIQLVQLSKQAANGKAYVAGNLTMTGEQLYPVGTMYFEELVDIYKEQVRYIIKGGVDLFVIETMMSLQETRAAIIAIKEVCDLPIMASLTYTEAGRTLFGTDPKTSVVVLQSLGVDVIGVNCSTGPDKMLNIVRELKEYANVPILAKANAGLPELVNGKTIYNMTPQQFAEEVVELVKAGANVVGGCCGTTPEHIRILAEQVSKLKIEPVSDMKRSLLASERMSLDIQLNGPFLVVGERINPTGKKKLQAELKENKLTEVMRMAEEQVKQGASILDINMGMNGINEKEMMVKVILEVSRSVDVPLCIDSSHIEVIESAIRIYPGRALINSISLEKEKFEKLIPIAKKYGAMFVLLPLSDSGLPKDLDEKKNIITTIMEEALSQGMNKEDIIVDGLVTTVGANPNAAVETLETIRYCKKELGLRTICGLSNISFGLPDRAFINSAFLNLAMKEGLTMAIANPSQEMLMKNAFATDLLLNKEGAVLRYIDYVSFQEAEHDTNNIEKVFKVEKENGFVTTNQLKRTIYENVMKGNKDIIIDNIKLGIEDKMTPNYIINDILIPAIQEVGVLFDKKRYFLPQLIASAEAMKTAIEYLEPMLVIEETMDEKVTIVCATVEGDIHDIGKNLVALLLKNYGYNVIDLGKDVSKEKIIDTAMKKNAKIIGLSALMTTTMMEMKRVIEYAKEKQCNAKVIIGGAVITQSFADEIGADGYSKDANDAVKLVNKLLQS